MWPPSAAATRNAIAAMIDFYGGAGTFASWPPRVRAYAVATTAVNITDWASAYGFRIVGGIAVGARYSRPRLCGEASHPAMRRLCALLGECIGGAAHATVDGAAHFMIATHAGEVADCSPSTHSAPKRPTPPHGKNRGVLPRK